MSEAVDNDSADSAFAEPNTDGLTFDVEGLVIKSVISFNGIEVAVSFGGGRGIFTHDGVTREYASFDEFELVGGFRDTPEYRALLNRIIIKMEEWREAGTELRLLGAPGKITTLIETDERWVPTPFLT